MKNATAIRTSIEHKVVEIVAVEIKHNGYIVYTVKSSGGKCHYTTTIAPDGHATGCTCPARKPCYHMTQLSEIEIYLKKAIAAPREEVASVIEEAEQVAEAAQQAIENAEVEADPDYAAWLEGFAAYVLAEEDEQMEEADPFAWWHALSQTERENATANYEMSRFPF